MQIALVYLNCAIEDLHSDVRVGCQPLYKAKKEDTKSERGRAAAAG